MKTLLLATACVLSSPFFSQSILPEGNSAFSQKRDSNKHCQLIGQRY